MSLLHRSVLAMLTALIILLSTVLLSACDAGCTWNKMAMFPTGIIEPQADIDEKETSAASEKIKKITYVFDSSGSMKGYLTSESVDDGILKNSCQTYRALIEEVGGMFDCTLEYKSSAKQELKSEGKGKAISIYQDFCDYATDPDSYYTKDSDLEDVIDAILSDIKSDTSGLTVLVSDMVFVESTAGSSAKTNDVVNRIGSYIFNSPAETPYGVSLFGIFSDFLYGTDTYEDSIDHFAFVSNQKISADKVDASVATRPLYLLVLGRQQLVQEFNDALDTAISGNKTLKAAEHHTVSYFKPDTTLVVSQDSTTPVDLSKTLDLFSDRADCSDASSQRKYVDPSYLFYAYPDADTHLACAASAQNLSCENYPLLVSRRNWSIEAADEAFAVPQEQREMLESIPIFKLFAGLDGILYNEACDVDDMYIDINLDVDRSGYDTVIRGLLDNTTTFTIMEATASTEYQQDAASMWKEAASIKSTKLINTGDGMTLRCFIDRTKLSERSTVLYKVEMNCSYTINDPQKITDTLNSEGKWLNDWTLNWDEYSQQIDTDSFSLINYTPNISRFNELNSIHVEKIVEKINSSLGKYTCYFGLSTQDYIDGRHNLYAANPTKEMALDANRGSYAFSYTDAMCIIERVMAKYTAAS